MVESSYVEPILVRGDMLAGLSSGAYQQGNPGDPNFGIVLPGAEALGGAEDLYRLVWYQNTDTVSSDFHNGQFWRLEAYDPAADGDSNPREGDGGWTVVPGFETLVPKHDIVSGLGAGDDYIVFDSSSGTPLLYNINGGLPTTPTTLAYLGSQEQGDLAAGDNDGQLDFADAYAAVVCFAAGTRIATPVGERPVQSLRPGDLVLTIDAGPMPIRWIHDQPVAAAALAARPGLRPVRIGRDALGPGRPARTLFVSPQHRLLLPTISAGAGTLIAAIHLTALPGIRQVVPRRGVKYHHLLLDRHAILLANGMPAESMLPGHHALQSLGPRDREAVLAMLPELAAPLPGLALRPARPIVRGAAAREIVRQAARVALAAMS